MGSLGLKCQSEHMAEPQSGNRAGAPVTLTGASGFVGRHVLRALLDANYSIRCLTRRPGVDLPSAVEVLRCDLTDPAAVAEATNGSAAVIYLAGTVRGREPADFTPANVTGLANIAQALAARDAATPLLLVSSLAASAPELSHYAASKAAGEQALRESGYSHWSILRPPAIYGSGDKELRSTFATIRKGLVPRVGPIEQRLPFIEVRDVATAVLAWLSHTEACRQQTYAIDDGTPGGYDWNAIAAAMAPKWHLTVPVPSPLLRMLGYVNLALAKVLGYAPMLTPGKAQELTHVGWSCNNQAFANATGWQPTLALSAGVAQLFAGH